MQDTFLKASSFEALAAYCACFRNVIGPVQGRAEVPEYLDEYGVTMPAEPGAGDPEKWYACIRAPFTVPEIEGIAAITEDEGREVLGVWA